jgi:hypothetical protein
MRSISICYRCVMKAPRRGPFTLCNVGASARSIHNRSKCRCLVRGPFTIDPNAAAGMFACGPSVFLLLCNVGATARSISPEHQSTPSCVQINCREQVLLAAVAMPRCGMRCLVLLHHTEVTIVLNLNLTAGPRVHSRAVRCTSLEFATATSRDAGRCSFCVTRVHVRFESHFADCISRFTCRSACDSRVCTCGGVHCRGGQQGN